MSHRAVAGLLAAAILCWWGSAPAGQRAITDTGDEVILNDDGTWHYAAEKKSQDAGSIPRNENKFEKAGDATFLLQSTVNDSAFWLNADKWAFAKAQNNTEAEYEFKLKGRDLYGLAISEEIEIPIASLVNIALSNARNAAPDIRPLKQEYRVVNGNEVIYMEMGGTMQGLKIIYMGYYYSNETGSTQLLTYTAENLADKYRPEAQQFLNGLVRQSPQ